MAFVPIRRVLNRGTPTLHGHGWHQKKPPPLRLSAGAQTEQTEFGAQIAPHATRRCELSQLGGA